MMYRNLQPLLCLFTAICLCSCSISNKKISGTYYSACTAYHKSVLILTVNKNSTFIYKLVNDIEKVSGKWIIRKDTLFLYSPFFPEKQYTGLQGYDAYVIKKKKLIGIKIGNLPFGKCPLVKYEKRK